MPRPITTSSRSERQAQFAEEAVPTLRFAEQLPLDAPTLAREKLIFQRSSGARGEACKPACRYRDREAAALRHCKAEAMRAPYAFSEPHQPREEQRPHFDTVVRTGGRVRRQVP